MSALAVAPNPDSRPGRSAPSGSLRVAFVNNMSEGGVRQTERLFARLLDASASGLEIEVRPYRVRALGEPGATEELPYGYAPLDDLFEHGADAVIVTGAEPRAPRLDEEAYWGDLQRLFDWIEEAGRPALLSCLAAHAALLHYDGVERRRLPAKCSGVFPQQVARHHLLGHGLPSSVSMPHSRYNDVPVAAVAAAGYEPVLQSTEVGWTVAARRQGRALLVLAQGHPEYSGTTLLREYRRDVGRYLARSQEDLPVLPRRCIEGPKAVTLRRFHERLPGVGRTPALMDEFPIDIRSVPGRAPWSGPAARLVNNWLSEVAAPAGAEPAVAPGACRSRPRRRTH
ncbi:MAG: homoserine O-succinyltransferase [Acidimicrobiales bacterium]|nr:homoserine O-succinyltransferase [Acidimicrobiales bacterium]